MNNLYDKINSHKKEQPKKKYIWKYLDFYKFLFFIENKSLYFSRLDNFEDILEGASLNFIHEMKALYMLTRMDKYNEKPDFTKNNENTFFNNLTYLKKIQKNYFAGCFYLSDSESGVMWDLYKSKLGFAIRFISKELFSIINDYYNGNFNNDFQFYYGIMDYENPVSFDVQFNTNKNKDTFNPFLKDNIYQHENEYRFVFKQTTNTENKSLEVKIPENINFRIYLDSSTENWQWILIEKMLKRYNIEDVRISGIVNRKVIQKHFKISL